MRTVLDLGWSILSPLQTLMVMKLMFNYFREATTGGMNALIEGNLRSI